MSELSVRLLEEHWARAQPAQKPEVTWEAMLAVEPQALQPGVPVALSSKVICATAHPEGVLVVRMEDRASKNLFSDEFIAGMAEVFQHASHYKVVVLTGYEQYFAAGGTQEALRAIQEGRAKFTDDETYKLALMCEVPVIAAMQGHAVGGGLCLGLFADFPILSAESKYVSPYMKYGFTPGAGATLIVPEKFGESLGRETLLSAQEYSGQELQQKGLTLPVHPRKQVLEVAMQLASKLARHSREALVEIKRQVTQGIRERLPDNTERELAMHEQTFVRQQRILNQIQTTYSPMDHNITGTLRQLLADELHMRLEDVDEDTQFVDLGLDSITGVTWMRKINERYQTNVQAVKVYSFPTLTKLSAYIKEQLGQPESHAAVPQVQENDSRKREVSLEAIARPASAPTRKSREKLVSWRNQKPSRVVAAESASAAREPLSQAIAIIGMAGQFPKAKTLDEYWENLSQGRNCISEIPPARWDISAYYQEESGIPGKTNSKWMGLLEEYDLFDPLFFEISPKEALSMDPQQRLFLQACWHALEHAGYNPKSFAGSKCGVFVGCGPGDYHLLSKDLQISALGFTGSDTSILAARVSYFLDLQGPCLAIETACSSSIVALATACDSLVSGNSDLALAGGVYVMAGPELHIKTSQTGMLSQDGRCFTFDHRANGFVPGEGVGAVLLKRLADAEKDGDRILGVIQGWGVNQDGKTNGITAPNPESQARLQQDIYTRFDIDPADIQLIEAHGTGTKLGDPIEVDALKHSFKHFTQKAGYCALGSVKSNIGHTFTAAGIASFIKVLLSLQHRKLPPTINFERLNEHIDLQGSPFYVNTQLRDWELQGAERRQAAISGFGFGGTNGHLVVAEYPISREKSGAPPVPVTENGRIAVPLSARTPEQLEQKVSDLYEFVIGDGRRLDLLDIAYTLQVGREAMDERVGFLVGSIDELAHKLKAYARGEQSAEGIFRGCANDSKEAMSLIRRDADVREVLIDRLISQRKLSKLLDLWVKDLEIDWNRLYGERKPQRVQLPLYPFAKDRYWIDAAQDSPFIAVSSAIHPLVRENTSSLSQQSYSATYGGTAGSFLELARAAVAHATSINVSELLDIAWGEAPADKDVTIALFANTDQSIDFEIYSGEAVHCQGRAVIGRASAPPQIDVDDASLSRLSLPVVSRDFVIHPNLLESAVALQSLRIVAPCTKEMLTRCEGSQVDFCDREGNVCVQLRGLCLQQAGAVEAPEVGITQAQLQQELKISLAKALYLKPSDIVADKPFVELGLDSIVGVEWVTEINKKYDLKLTATKIYDYTNVTEFAAFLEGVLPKKASVTLPSAAAPKLTKRSRASSRTLLAATTPAVAPVSGKIAIIGMSGRYPQANNLQQYWENLAAGRNSISEIPPSRWDVNKYYDPDTTKTDKIYCKWLGMLDDVDCFDSLFFRISPAEAKSMDPQHRLFLEESYKAFENAGYSSKALSNKKCGVYLGIIGNEYAAMVAESNGGTVDLTGNNLAIGAARVAYFLNLKGPAISIDTACSSSLVAIHLACQGLIHRETDMALAGGSTVYLRPESYLGMCQAGMLSPDGQCKTFDNSANGFVPGEGAGVVVLKRLEDAERDGDVIHGVILASGINQDGKTNGITAPSVNSQIELGRELYARHQIDPETISYVEAHGTGTRLGDPIELEALATVFKEKTAKKNYCGLGSVKSNIGHTSGAAGVASVQKVLLCMQQKTLVPTLNVTQENALFDFAGSPFYVSKTRRSWDSSPGAPRRAGVSSFGFSGTNAHLVLEEYSPRAAYVPVPASGVIIPLSARTPEQLREKAGDLLRFVRSGDHDLMAIAYTLFTGRDEMSERLNLIVRSVDELAGKLQGFIDGAQTSETSAELDWKTLYGEMKPRRIALPTYPFARKRYWVDPAPARTVVATNATHPLLHRDNSVLGEQSHSSTFTGAELFLLPEKIFPAAAYLEMARAAVEAASKSTRPEIQNVVWGRPLVATPDRQVNIALFKKSDAQIDFEIYSLDPNGEEIVHCQGHALLSRKPASGRIEVSKHKLTKLSVPTNRDGFVLHPSVLDSALQSAFGLMAHSLRRPRNLSLPLALDALTIESLPGTEIFACARYSEGSRAQDTFIKLDVDLCDGDGNVLVSARGLTYQQEVFELPRAAPPSEPKRVEPVSATATKKPVTVSLSDASVPAIDTRPKAVTLITLDL